MERVDKRILLNRVFESSLDAIIISDEKGYIIEVNRAYMELTGYKKDEIIGKHTSEFSPMKEGTYECTTGELIQIDKKFSEQLKATMKTYIEVGKLQNVMGYQLRKDHKIVPVEDTMVFLVGDDGERMGGVAFIRDNTVRRKGEIEITKTKEYLENLFMTSVDGIIIADSKGRITTVNKAIEKIFDCSSDQLVGKHFNEMRFEEERLRIEGAELMNKLLNKGAISGVERTWKKPDGTAVIVEVNISLLKDDEGDITGSVASIRDITGRKQTEEKLINTRDYLENILESSLDGIVVSDNMGYITKANKAFLNIVGYKEEEVIGKMMTEFSPTEEGTYKSTTEEFVEIDKQYLSETATMVSKFLRDKKVSNWETYLLSKNKQIIPVDINIAILYEGEDRIGAVGVLRNVSGSKKAGKEIKEGKDFLENIIESSMDGIAIVDEKGYIISVNTALVKMSKFRKGRLIGKHISILTMEDEDVRKNILKKTRELFETGFASYESKHKMGENNYIDVECNISLVKDDKGNNIAGIAIIRDITERKKAEKQIRDARDFLENVLKTSLDGILVTEPKGRITLTNKALEKLLGYSKGELIGKYTKELIPQGEEYVDSGKKFLTKLFEEGAVKDFQYRWLRKDKSIVDIEANSALLKDSDGNITGAVAIIRNITERKHYEQNIINYQNQLKSLAAQLITSEEQNRQNFATFLHDRIGQELFVSKLKLEMMQKSKSLKENKESSKEILTTIVQLMKDTRSLTSELSPPILHELGLSAGLAWLAENVSKREGIIVQFDDDKQPRSLSKPINILIFSAVRELLINVIKHAKAQNVKVSMLSDKTSVRVSVEDDGIGINASETTIPLSNNNSFGLFSIKERLNSVGGDLEIKSPPGHGTRITLHIPHESKN